MSSATSQDPTRWVRPELRAIPPYTLDLSPCRFKLDQNECAWELPLPVKRRVVEALVAKPWGRYPDFHGDELREELGRRWSWPAEGVLVGNGSNELLGVALDALVGPGRTVLGADPTFGLYRRMIERSGGEACFLPPRDDLRLPREALLHAIDAQPERPLLLCSPNNPTGDALAPAELAELLDRLEGPLLLDAAYVEYSEYDYRPLLDRYPNLLIFGT
ncbi:MAG: aminotransferase class I/II-fold pyridoxal phosphate-dependent enzyme, partial [Thermoanaerobaculia bacterium]|nr:aminotransferase class I/II-fold pyridoxal phosphate-dependent enzyme [Thermoanaerobaculia bacterium]